MLNARLRLATPRRRIDGASSVAAYSAESIWIHPSTGGLTRCTKAHANSKLIYLDVVITI